VQFGFHTSGASSTEQPRVSVFSYYRSSPRTPWAGLSDLSALFLDRTPTRKHPLAWSYLSRADQLGAPLCLSTGQYRMEVYMNGRLALSAVASPTLDATRPKVFEDLGVEGCLPVGWTRQQTGASGAVAEYKASDSQSGLILFRYEGQQEESTATWIKHALGVVRKALPGKVRAHGRSAEYQGFMTLQHTLVQWHAYPGGNVLAGGGMDVDGAEILAVAFGPSSASDVTREVVGSLTLTPSHAF